MLACMALIPAKALYQPNAFSTPNTRKTHRCVNATLERAIRERTDFYLDEYRIHHTDGSIRFLRAIGHRNASGEPGEYVGVTMDITEQKHADQEREKLRQLEADLTQELRREKAYLAEAQSLAHIGSWATNFHTKQMFHLSDEIYRLHGFDPSQGPIPLERFWATLHPEDAAGGERNYRKCYPRPNGLRYPRISHSSGRRRPDQIPAYHRTSQSC